ncbi:MAG: hypothetical protein MHM6MM_000445 [Cercozoa sp. M6MM]
MWAWIWGDGSVEKSKNSEETWEEVSETMSLEQQVQALQRQVRQLNLRLSQLERPEMPSTVQHGIIALEPTHPLLRSVEHEQQFLDELKDALQGAIKLRPITIKLGKGYRKSESKVETECDSDTSDSDSDSSSTSLSLLRNRLQLHRNRIAGFLDEDEDNDENLE